MTEHATTPTDALPRRRPPIGGLLTLTGGLLGLAAAVMFWLGMQDAEDTAGAAVTQKDDVVQAAGPVCERPQPDAQLSALCAEVQHAKLDPVEIPAAAEQVDYDRVEALVADAWERDPRLSEAALMGMVRRVYREDPPADGDTPTDAELLVLVRQVYAENPPAPGVDGQDGADGAPGQNAYCYDNPEDPACQPREGRPGVDGAPGARGARGEPPFGWSTTYPDGSREDCRRADPFDPAEPRYTCQFTPAAPSEEPPPDDGLPLPGGG